MGGEYASGLFRTTFTAVPARGSVAAAKLVVLTAATTVLVTLGSAIAFAIAPGGPVRPGWHLGR
ncbi:hypothetical protein [Micromonospora inyonensis]|uniref:Uncharacterized protein n=1 Tax=Micromonospora inyonensis TaxID=47866 RepID=A0A1C6S2H7_9ACTN|nr:hypothetical protein [Micromonospora inyonensis]SCL23575.1 hypothetical protein GA0074694_3686 [Micromonospora inyonensis]